MIVKNNYSECITNLACSIKKYFELEYEHNTLDYVDKLLEEKKPKNVVVILFDGMGAKILNRTLSKDDFFIRHMKKEITTVFPATTTAATYSAMTGLNPVEHGYLGWYSYVEPLDDVILLFRGESKCSKQLNPSYNTVRQKYFISKTITDEINEKGKFKSRILFPFGKDKYNDLDDMLNIIRKECKYDGKKYIYAYDDEPDHTMHGFGPDCEQTKTLIKTRNDKVQELCKNLTDTIIFVIADHGHIKVENMFLDDYPQILDLLERTTSLEQRTISFKVKQGMQKEFEKAFNEVFGTYFTLYTADEIVSSKLFGDGTESPLFRSALGDYIAIAENSNKAIVADGDEILFSQHAGYTDDEILIPLIIIDRT